MQIKTIMRYHFTCTRTAIIKMTDNKVLVRMKRYWNPYMLLVGMQTGAAVIPLLGTSPREMKTYVHIKTCT